MKTSAYFRCPDCKTSQAKSEHDRILSGARFFMFGPAIVLCRACGRAIDRAALANGDYDDHVTPLRDLAGFIAIAVLVPALMYFFDVRFWVALIPSLIIGGMIMGGGSSARAMILFFFVVSGSTSASAQNLWDLKDLDNLPLWKSAIEYKRELEASPDAVTAVERERLVQIYRRLATEKRQLTLLAWALKGRADVHEDDRRKYEEDRRRYESSCATYTDAETARCESWLGRLKLWQQDLRNSYETIDKERQRLVTRGSLWIDQVQADFNWPVHFALQPSTQTWRFTSRDAEGREHVAIVQVDADGVFRGSGWMSTVEGCKPRQFPLDIKGGRFTRASVAFHVEGSGCNGQSTIRGVGEGNADQPFPLATSVSGEIHGSILDPLTISRIKEATSLSRLKEVVSSIIDGADFDQIVSGKSLVDAKWAVSTQGERRYTIKWWGTRTKKGGT